jgi:hypothetical protein
LLVWFKAKSFVVQCPDVVIQESDALREMFVTAVEMLFRHRNREMFARENAQERSRVFLAHRIDARRILFDPASVASRFGVLTPSKQSVMYNFTRLHNQRI